MRTWHEIRQFPLAVRLLLVNQLGVNTGFYLLVPYLATHLTDNLGMSAAVVGVVLGVRNLSQQGLFIIGGSAADRLGARGVIIAGCGLRTVGFALFALGDSPAVLLAASVLSGLAGALFNPAVRAYLAQEAGERKAEAFALFNVFATTGALIGPLLGSGDVVDRQVSHPMGGNALEVRLGQLEDAAHRTAFLVGHPVAGAVGKCGRLEVPTQGYAIEMPGLVGVPGVEFVPPDLQGRGRHAILPFCLLRGVVKSPSEGRIGSEPGIRVARQRFIVAEGWFGR